MSKKHNLNHPFEISFVSQNFKKEIEMVKIAHLSDAEFDQYVDEMYRKEAFSVDYVRFLMQQKKTLLCKISRYCNSILPGVVYHPHHRETFPFPAVQGRAIVARPFGL